MRCWFKGWHETDIDAVLFILLNGCNRLEADLQKARKKTQSSNNNNGIRPMLDLVVRAFDH
jgi:hypothetical protein